MNTVNDAFMAQASVLRVMTAGSVDDGKSTLIGRLLHDSQGLLTDQLDHLYQSSSGEGAGALPDFAGLVDGLEAEREQGITIDVAYRYLATPRRKFIVADAPGHEQYTRNMATAASTAEVAVILIDAVRVCEGELLDQTRRHATLAALLGLKHVVMAINKMDLLHWDPQVYERIVTACAQLAESLGLRSWQALPISALHGDNVVLASHHTPWYAGPPLLELLESLDVQPVPDGQPLRLPIQTVLRHEGATPASRRSYCGEIASGCLAVGDGVKVLPGGARSRVAAIATPRGAVERAEAGTPVAVQVADDLDISRGDVLVAADADVVVGRRLEADLCWLDDQPWQETRRYGLKQGTRSTSAQITAILSRRDLRRLETGVESATTLGMNDIARVSLSTRDTVLLDPYDDLPAIGAFILLDPGTHQTVAAGMIRAAVNPGV